MHNRVPSFGLFYDFRQKVPLEDYTRFYAECLEEIVAGEHLGFRSVWLCEHHFVDDGFLPSPLVVAAAIAAQTKQMRIGTNVLLLPLHHPLRVAEDASVVDLISGGRFTLGVGQGYVQHEFETLGFDRRERPSRFEEGVNIIRDAWSRGRTAHNGKHWRFADLPFEPRSGRHIPIYFGAMSDPAIDRAARMADGFLSYSGEADFQGMYDKLQDALLRHNRAGAAFPFVASGIVYLDTDSARAQAVAGPAIAYQNNCYAEWGTDRGNVPPRLMQPADLALERYLVGTPEIVADGLIERYRAAPFDHFCFWGRLPGVTHQEALRSMHLFATMVVPKVLDVVHRL